MIETISLPPGLDGRVVRDRVGDLRVWPHRHVELELNLVVAGTATYLVGARRYDLEPATLTWLFPGQEHVLVNRSADHELWWGVFSPDLVGRTLGGDHALTAHDPAGSFSRRIGRGPARRLASLLGEVGNAADLHPAIARAVQLLRADPNQQDLAGQVGLSRTHLSRLFAAETGITVVEFRNRERLQRYALLRDRYGSTLEAALAAGFGSYAQFYRVFRDATGHAPSADPAD